MMAGTGHSYEIANIGDVRLLVDECAGMSDDPAATAWFRGKPFLRYATSDKFVLKIRKNASRAFLDAVDDREREFIVRKLDAGQDIRLFSRDQFNRFGPDVRHAIDWIDLLRVSKPTEHAKISKMGPEDLFRKVSVWIPPRSRGTKLPDGKMRHVLTTEDGYVWYELEDALALRAEGDAMSHCVDGLGYARNLEMGELRILSMRSGEGARLLTMELRGGETVEHPWHVRQIQAFANAAAPQAAIGSICAVLNHLAVAPRQSQEERRARIAHSAEHGWQSIYQTWTRVDFLDMDCISDGSEFIVMSPIHPDRPLLSISSPTMGAFRPMLSGAAEPPEGNYTATLADTRHYSIEELRAAADVINAFGADHSHNSVFAGRDRAIPFVDSLVEEVADGHVFLRSPQTGNAYVTSETDKAMILLEIGKEPRFAGFDPGRYWTMPAWVCNMPRWKNADAIRCFAAMSAVKSDFFGTAAAEMKPITQQFEPVRASEGEWRSFALEARRHDSRKPGIHWMETGYQLAFFNEGRRLADFTLRGGQLRHLPYTWPFKGIECKEVATRFNGLRITPAADIVGSKLGNRLGRKRGAEENLVCVAGQWKTVRSQHDLLRMVGSGENLTPGEAAVVLQTLPEDPAHRMRETDALYAACLVRKLSAMEPTHVVMPYRDDRKSLLWLYDNIALVPQSLRKAAAKHASILLDRWSKGSRDFLVKTDDHVRIFFAVWRHLPKSVLNRVVSYVFRKCRYWLGRDADDIRWIREVFPFLENDKAKDAMFHGIDHGANALTTTCPDILLVNALCLQIYARQQRVLIDYRLETLKEAYHKLVATDVSADKRNVMNEVETLIASIPEIVAARRAEAERIHLEWTRKFTRNNDLDETSAAA
jgi:hypothetical protein